MVKMNDRIHVTNKSKLTFKGMWNRSDLSDIKLCCDKKVFKVHRILLAACSPYFRSLFRENASLDRINLDDVNSEDLRRVLLYMYEGSVIVKNEELDGFGELLEMFWMQLPDEMWADSSECDSESESASDDSSYEVDGVDIDQFVLKVHNLLKDIKPNTVDSLAKEILDVSRGSNHRFGTILNIIIQSVVELTPKCRSSELSSLVKFICQQDQSQKFQQQIREKSIQLLRFLTNASPNTKKPLQLPNIDGNILDKEVVRIENIEYNWDSIRGQRLTHFIGQIFRSDLAQLTDIYNVMKSDAKILKTATDLIIAENFQCCDLEVPLDAQNVLQNEEYQYARKVENHLFWLRIENNQHELQDFTPLINSAPSRRERKRNRNRKRSKEGGKVKSKSKNKKKNKTQDQNRNQEPSTSKK